ncbi:methyltransferase domain-containing protein [Candidatus Nomurabacteria bacterium]|nr:methyltransferase domain-containing protein [Candidatus Nomurabacteria bacterium]
MKFNFEKKDKNINKSTEMYLDSGIAEEFARREKEDTVEHSVVSGVLDNLVTESFKDKKIKIANLGAGANPQKYEGILKKIKEGSTLDWVDISSKMLDIASKEVDQDDNVNFIKNDFTGYLNTQEDGTLDCVMMQYSINYIENLEDFLKILSKKLNKDGIFVANIGRPVLENNQYVNFLINGEEFTGKRNLVDGDRYTIKFLNQDKTVFASTEKIFFSDEKIKSTSELLNLTPEIKDIKGFKVLIVKK